MSSRRRLMVLRTQLCPAAATVEKVDSAQGLALRSTRQPPTFTKDQKEDLVAFFRREGYAVLVGAYSPEEVKFLNNLWDESQAERPEIWGIRKDGVVRDIEYHHPLLDYPQLDPFVRHPGSIASFCRPASLRLCLSIALSLSPCCIFEMPLTGQVRHPSSYPIVEEILGKGAPRYSEFNFRETPPNRGRGNMGFHFDRTPSNAGTMDQRTKLDHLTEPPDYICTIHCELHTMR